MSTKLDFSNLSAFDLNVVLNSVLKCIKRASKHNGKVFGGFVRNVVVPRLCDPKCPVSFKDVDLWFTCQSDVDLFVSSMGSLLLKTPDNSTTEDSYPGAFNRTQYHLVKFDTCLAWIDVILSPILPVNDFDVNEVTYALDNYDKWVTTSSARLLDQIMDEHAIMLPSYKLLIDRAKDSGRDNYPGYKIYYEERIKRIFLSKGWRVSIPVDISGLTAIKTA